MNASVIGKKIKTLRESKNISREDFANAVKISLSALSMYETGQRIPRDEVKLRIARFLNTTIEELFFYKLSTRFVNLIKILQPKPKTKGG
ncbi:XRE family transcriptional regulator [Ruminococcus bromii]|nr:XRE family transcriptional regulator [Ruminococcus bromii]